uniref:Uncharacterized protein n=1 Tax=Coccidioides posadasii RMSCC 3488 TaxID=454284 RepID=A0A0J6FPM4_COCPO|nr:hypothetical protein CPAG_07234 [Coccidioides posadasii RMSCC 3488]
MVLGRAKLQMGDGRWVYWLAPQPSAEQESSRKVLEKGEKKRRKASEGRRAAVIKGPFYPPASQRSPPGPSAHPTTHHHQADQPIITRHSPQLNLPSSSLTSKLIPSSRSAIPSNPSRTPDGGPHRRILYYPFTSIHDIPSRVAS